MVSDLRGRLADAADYVRNIWLQYNLHRPIIRDMTNNERERLLFGDDDLLDE